MENNFEEFLKEAFAEVYKGTESFERWVVGLDPVKFMEYADQFGEHVMLKERKRIMDILIEETSPIMDGIISGKQEVTFETLRQSNANWAKASRRILLRTVQLEDIDEFEKGLDASMKEALKKATPEDEKES